MRKPEASRLFYILEAIKRNPSVDRTEIDARLEKKAANHQLAVEKGHASVRAIILALQAHPEIASLKETEPYSSRDLSGLDIQVNFHPDQPLYTIGKVWIQAKSSPTGAQRFIAHHGQAYLLQRKIIVLIGTQSPEEIVTSFDHQLQEIIYYHRFY